MSKDFVPIVDLLIEGEDQAAEHHLLMENTEEQIVRILGDSSMMNYLMKFEEYLDDHDIYIFDGWEEAEVIARPIIDKFWVTFYLKVGKDTDLRGALRLMNDKEGQNKVQAKKDGSGQILKFKILRRYLDDIEEKNKDKAAQLSDQEMEHLG